MTYHDYRKTFSLPVYQFDLLFEQIEARKNWCTENIGQWYVYRWVDLKRTAFFFQNETDRQKFIDAWIDDVPVPKKDLIQQIDDAFGENWYSDKKAVIVAFIKKHFGVE